ncbi:MAG: coenzyme F420-0:L-glutamate ligase [Nitrososphaerales archaeon]
MGRPESIQLIPIRAELRFERFDLAEVILDEMRRNHVFLRNRDIVVVSSKFAAVSEGRVVILCEVIPTREAIDLAKSFRVSPALAQLVIEESSLILGGIPGFVLALTGEVLAPNAGIDRSNAPKGSAVLYPKNPMKSAGELHRKLLAKTNRGRRAAGISQLGVILSDSRVTPTRLGTTGIAIAFAGIRPTVDMRGKRDLFANKLKVTLRALADQLASAAQIPMGEASESTPIVIIRGAESAFEHPRNELERRASISVDRCLIISGLKKGYKDKKRKIV